MYYKAIRTGICAAVNDDMGDTTETHTPMPQLAHKQDVVRRLVHIGTRSVLKQHTPAYLDR